MKKKIKLKLKAVYYCTCAICGAVNLVKPSEFMEMGFNVASGNCSNCNSPVHFEIVPDINGSEMKSETWPHLFERLKSEFA